MCVSWWWNGITGASRVSETLKQSLQKIVDEADIIVGFNFKFDYHWLTKWGISLEHKRIWDCQLFEFLIEFQTNRFPSLEQACTKYGLGNKIDIIKSEYWDKGINTDEIPWEILKAYAIKDAELTYRLYAAQHKVPINRQQSSLLTLLNADLHVLKEMETNGILYDSELCQKRSSEIHSRIAQIEKELGAVYPDLVINFGSPDQLSAYLYGGVIKQTVKEHVGFYKSGKQQGQPKYQNKIVEHQLPRIYEPIKGSELKKEGVFQTNEDTLLKLKGKKGPIQLLLEHAKLQKLLGTYYDGLPARNAKMNWPVNMLHGNFNQCVVVTGRLSSDKPNLQNMASELQDIFITRY